MNAETKHDTVYFESKKHIVGLTGGFGWNKSHISFDIRYGYFLPNKINLGFNAGYSDRGYHIYNFGPNLRYYLLRRNITPIIEVNANYYLKNYGSYTYEKQKNLYHMYQLTFGAGYSFGILRKKFGIDGTAYIGRQSGFKKAYEAILIYGLIIRFNFHF